MSNIEYLDMSDLIPIDQEDCVLEVVKTESSYPTPSLYVSRSLNDIAYNVFDTAPPPPNYAMWIRLSRNK